MMHPRKGEFFSSRVRYISLNQIRPNPQQPRRRFDSESLQELLRRGFPVGAGGKHPQLRHPPAPDGAPSGDRL